MTDQARTDWVTSTLARMSRKQLIGQLFIQYVYGAAADTRDPRNTELFGVDTPAAVVAEYQLGGVIYFDWTDNLRDPDQIAALSEGLQTAAPRVAGDRVIPLQLAIDQEMGVVTRIGAPATQFPGSMALGATGDPALARTAAAITGQELRALGINLDFAPCSDVNVNPANPVIGVRSFGSNPELVAGMVAAQVAGYQEDGRVSSATKHFPGHGDTGTDSHTGLPVITHTRQQWASIDAPGFEAAIAAGVDLVMSAHLVMTAFDDSGDVATLSRPILTGLLREQLGYTGVVVTDSLEMQGVRQRYGDGEVAVRALEAGADQLLMAPDLVAAVAAVEAAVDSGRITLDLLRDKVRRILTLKHRRLAGQPPPVAVIGTEAHRQAAARLTDRTVTLVRNDAAVLPLSAAGVRIAVVGFGAAMAGRVAGELDARGATVALVEAGTSPAGHLTDAAVAAANGSDAVVVLTNRAWANEPQAAAVRRLIGTGKSVVVVAVRDPYDINRFPEATTYVCTYSDSPVVPPALVRVLTGEVGPTGRLPVDLPAADRGRILHPYGTGLTY